MLFAAPAPDVEGAALAEKRALERFLRDTEGAEYAEWIVIVAIVIVVCIALYTNLVPLELRDMLEMSVSRVTSVGR